MYASFGIEPGFVARVEAVKPPALWYPTRNELIAARVLTGQLLLNEFLKCGEPSPPDIINGGTDMGDALRYVVTDADAQGYRLQSPVEQKTRNGILSTVSVFGGPAPLFRPTELLRK
jgi:hypothetical protein